MKYGEMIEMNATMTDIMAYLQERLGTERAYVPYGEIAKKVNKSRHAVAYAIERLRRQRALAVEDGKLYIVNA